METRAPAVTVIMAAYNGEKYLSDALDSILSQTLQDFEVVVVDDGSTDSTGEILEQYAAHDKRIRVVHQQNAGCPAARNRAIALARGRYVAQHDHDDLSMPERLEKQAAFLDAHPEICAVFCWCVMTDKFLNPVYTRLAPEDDGWIRKVLRRENRLHVNYMARRGTLEEIGCYRDAFALSEDYDLNLRLLEHGKVHCLPEVLYVYRRHENQESIVRKMDMKRFIALAGAFAFERRVRGRDSYPQFEKSRDIERFVRDYEFRDLCFITAERINLNKPNRDAARKYLRLAARESGWKIRSLFSLAKSYLPHFFLKAHASLKTRFLRRRWTGRVPAEVAEWLLSRRQRTAVENQNRPTRDNE